MILPFQIKKKFELDLNIKIIFPNIQKQKFYKKKFRYFSHNEKLFW